MTTTEAKREYWNNDSQPPYMQTYGGVLDLANGFDLSSSFESHLKFQALFFEKIIVPDGFFYMPGPIFENVRRLRDHGLREDENVTIQLLKNGVIVPALRDGESLLENWNKAVKGIKPGEMGYPTKPEGAQILEVIEPRIATYTRWPQVMADAMKPPYSAELHRLFVEEADRSPLIGRGELSFLLKLKGFPTKGWHSLLERFQESIVTQIAGQEFRRAGLEQAVVSHFALPRFSGVYEFLTQTAKTRKHERWAEVAVAQRLLQISSTVYEAYQARQFNSVGNLLPGFFRPVVNAELYTRVVELNAGRPYSGGEIVPALCINPRKMSLKKIIDFRNSVLFKEQYCGMLRQLKDGEREQSFVENNAAFYRFLETSYLPAILEAFGPAVDRERLKRLGQLAQAGSIVAGGAVGATALSSGAPVHTLFTHISVFGIPLLATVAVLGSLGKGLAVAADGIAQITTRSRNAWLMRGATQRLNGFIAMERAAAEGARKPQPRANNPVAVDAITSKLKGQT